MAMQNGKDDSIDSIGNNEAEPAEITDLAKQATRSDNDDTSDLPDDASLSDDPEDGGIPDELIVAQLNALARGNVHKNDLYDELVAGSESVLDLGCGTGSRSLEMAENSQVVAVDSAQVLLELATSRDTNKGVEWICENPATIRLNRKFDLIVLGDYYFQTLLTIEAQSAALTTVVEHLNKDGRFILACHNPAVGIDINPTRKSLPNMLNHTGLGLIEAWNESEFDEATSILTSTNGFDISSQHRTLSETVSLRYSTKDEIASAIDKAGLHAIKWLGDWSGNLWQSDSPDIILVGRLAAAQFSL